MGLFDGIRQEIGRTGASADIAALFGWPVILVLDVSGHAQSAAAVALGCARYDPRIAVAGVVLNKVASERHRRLVEDGMARIGLPVLGALMRNTDLTLPERHLGLVQAGETEELDARLERLADAVESAVDLDRLVALARPTRLDPAEGGHAPAAAGPAHRAGRRPRLLLRLSACARRLARGGRGDRPLLSPGRRASASRIATSAGCRAAIRNCTPAASLPRSAFSAGCEALPRAKPVHGECGGYMVLGRSLEDGDGVAHAMADLLPVETSYAKRKMHLGYRVARLVADGVLGTAGQCLVGHEFHYASVVDSDTSPEAAFATIADAEGNGLGATGHRRGHVTGSFFHVIAPG